MPVIGRFPEVSIKEARERRGEARGLLRQGIDPVQHYEKLKYTGEVQPGSSFERVIHECLRAAVADTSKLAQESERSVLRPVFPLKFASS